MVGASDNQKKIREKKSLTANNSVRDLERDP